MRAEMMRNTWSSTQPTQLYALSLLSHDWLPAAPTLQATTNRSAPVYFPGFIKSVSTCIEKHIILFWNKKSYSVDNDQTISHITLDTCCISHSPTWSNSSTRLLLLQRLNWLDYVYNTLKHHKHDKTFAQYDQHIKNYKKIKH